jgi:hypothetical protein
MFNDVHHMTYSEVSTKGKIKLLSSPRYRVLRKGHRMRYGGAWRVCDTGNTALRSKYMAFVIFGCHAKDTRKRMTKMTTMVRSRVKAWPSTTCVLKVRSLSLLDHISVPHNFHQRRHDLHQTAPPWRHTCCLFSSTTSYQCIILQSQPD